LEVRREPFSEEGVMNTTGIWSDKDRVSGKPCIRNTRLSISEDFNVDYDKVWSAWVSMVNELCLLKINSSYIIRSDVNYIKGSEAPVSYVLMKLLTDNLKPSELLFERGLDYETVRGALNDLAMLLDRNWTTGPPEDIEKAIAGGPT
jgi:hypothetical protein